MVRYNTKAIPAGIPAEAFILGFQDPAVVKFILPEGQPFQIPLKHACSVEHLKKAFEGGFEEANTLTMELDDDPSVFSLFLKWLYHGFPQEIAEADKSNFVIWTKFYVLMDRWCIHDPLPQITRRIWNMMLDAHRQIRFAPTSTNAGGVRNIAFCKGVTDCYLLTQNLGLRYLFVHQAHQYNTFWWPAGFLDVLPNSSFGTDMARWYWLMETITKSNGARYEPNKHEDTPEETAHEWDRVILPFLSKAENWPTEVKLSFPNSWKEAREDPASYLRNFLA